METLDPEVDAQLYVMQWMHESGHHDALRALEKQLGRLYDDTQLPEASQLMQLVWRHVEERLLEQEELEGDEGVEAEREAEDKGKGTTNSTTASSTHNSTTASTTIMKTAAVTTTTTAAAAAAATSTHRRRRHHREEALRLLRSGCEDYAGRSVLAEVGPNVHGANIIAVRLVPGQEDIRVITAAGDGAVRCLKMGAKAAAAAATATTATTTTATTTATSTSIIDGGNTGGNGGGGGSSDGPVVVVWETRLGSSALLSLALHPSYRSGVPLVAVGGMDGRISVLYGTTGVLLSTTQPHTKYVVRIAWAAVSSAHVAADAAANGMDANGDGGSDGGRDGDGGDAGAASATAVRVPMMSYLLVSASMDETVVLHRFEVERLDGTELHEGGGKLSVVRQVPYGTAVTDAAFLPDGHTLAVAVRGSNYLRLLDCQELARRQTCGLPGAGELPEQLVNLNEAGDDHVSFTAKYLAVSCCGKYLLVCTDTPRLLVLHTSDWTLLRCLFGLPTDTFPQPAAAWHRDSSYIYVSGAQAQLCVFHVGSGRLVHTSQPHRINLRDLDYDPTTNRLATCSFDKIVKVLGPAAA